MELRERARGMMVGIGVGNLLGIPWEGWSREAIEERNPGGVREMTACEGYPDDDDLAQAILLAEACIETDSLDVSDLMRRFWVWGEMNGAGMGGSTRVVLERYGGADPRRGLRNWASFRTPPPAEPRKPRGVAATDAARLAWEASGTDPESRSMGNGSVMRCGPVALRWMGDDAALVRNSVVSAVVTHWDPRCLWATLLADLAIASCLRGEPVEAGALLDRARSAVRASSAQTASYELPEKPPTIVEDAVEIALARDARIEDLDLGEGGGHAWTAPKTLSAALWASKHPKSVEEGLAAIVSAGDDTDTNAAPAGAALGARFGIGGFPSRWLDRTSEIRAYEESIEGWIERRPLEYYADKLLGLIDARR